MSSRVRIGISIFVLLAAAVAVTAAYAVAGGAYGGSITGQEQEYTLMECDGVIAVYHRGEVERMTDIGVSTLRQADRDMLGEGIGAGTEEELLLLLEDLGS